MTDEQEKREYFRRLYTEDPAKHYVRMHGWLEPARQRLQKIHSQGRRKTDFVKYFTFPGEYAIDVLLFAENGILDENQLGFPGVVYCEKNIETANVIGKKLGRCRAVFRDTFENAVRRKDFRTYCPFDIINLDLTREIFPVWESTESKTIHAIEELLSLHKDCDFDLYLTFKSSPPETNKSAVREFIEMINDNFTTHADLKQEFTRACGMDATQLQKKNATLFWCKSFPKWIFETSIVDDIAGSLQGEYVYSRESKNREIYHIVTFVFEFRRKKSGLMGRHKMIKDVHANVFGSFSVPPFDVDSHLKAHDGEKQNLKNDAIRLSKKPPKIA